MAQRQVGATEFAQGGSDPLAHSNLHNQSVHLDGNTMVGHPGSSTAGESDTHNVTSTMSQSHTLTPSRGGTLKKRQSLSRKNSLKRTGSRKDSRPASVKSLTFADDVGGYGSEMTSAFFTPVPTTGSPTEILANRFQGRFRFADHMEQLQKGHALIRLTVSLAEGAQRSDHLLSGHPKILRRPLQISLYNLKCHYEHPYSSPLRIRRRNQ